MKFILFIFSALCAINIGGSTTLTQLSQKLTQSQQKYKFAGTGIIKPELPQQLPLITEQKLEHVHGNKKKEADDITFITSDEAIFYVKKDIVAESKFLEDMIIDNPGLEIYQLPIPEDKFAFLTSLLQQADLEKKAALGRENAPIKFWNELSTENIKLATEFYEEYHIPTIKQPLLETMGNVLKNTLVDTKYKKELVGSLTPNLQNVLKNDIILPNYLGTKYLNPVVVEYLKQDKIITGDTCADEYLFITESQDHIHRKINPWTGESFKMPSEKFQKVRYNLKCTMFFGIGTQRVAVYLLNQNQAKDIDFHFPITAFTVGSEDYIAVGTQNGIIAVFITPESLNIESIWQASIENRYPKLLAFPANDNTMLAQVDSKNALLLLSVGTKEIMHYNQLPPAEYLDMIFVNRNQWIILISTTSIFIIDWLTGKKIAQKDFGIFEQQPYFNNGARLIKKNDDSISIYHFSPTKTYVIQQELNIKDLIQKYAQLKKNSLLVWQEQGPSISYKQITDRIKNSFKDWINYFRSGLTKKKQRALNLD